MHNVQGRKNLLFSLCGPWQAKWHFYNFPRLLVISNLNLVKRSKEKETRKGTCELALAQWQGGFTPNCGSRNSANHIDHSRRFENSFLKFLLCESICSRHCLQQTVFAIFLSVTLFFNLQVRWSLLEDGHLYLSSGRNNCSGTKRAQPRPVSFQKLMSRTLMPSPTARKTIQNTAQRTLSQTPVHNSSTDRSSASPLHQSHMHVGSHNRKKAFQSSFNKTYSGDLLDKHSIYFTEKKQCFTPQILKTSHQSFLVKHRCYNPPPQKKGSSPGRSSLKSADINNEKRELHRYLLSLFTHQC